MLRLADADVLPFDFTGLADAVARYVKEVRDLAKDRREAAEEKNRQIDEGVPEAVADPRKPFVPPGEGAARSRLRLLAARKGVGISHGRRRKNTTPPSPPPGESTGRVWRESTRSCDRPSER